MGDELHPRIDHPLEGCVEVVDGEEETDPTRHLIADRRPLVVAVGLGEQKPGLASPWANDDPPLRPSVVCGGGGVLRQLEAEYVDEECDRRVVVVDDEGHEAQHRLSMDGGNRYGVPPGGTYTPWMSDPVHEIDVDAVRADTPAVDQIAHLNNCGTSLPPEPVLEATIDYLKLEATVGGYEAMDVAAEELSRVYYAGAELLGCRPDELAFSTGASEAWWRAFLSVPLVAGDRVLIGRTEYIANALALIQASARGISVEIVPDDGSGQIDIEALEKMIDGRVKLVCLTSIAMTNGLVNPTAEVGAVVKAAGAYFLVDACQAVGQIPVDVDEWQCDFLSFTGRKFVRGPRGSGMLYVRSSIMDELEQPPFIDGRSASWTSDHKYELQPTAQRFEFFECSFAAKVGFGRAIDYALELGLDSIDRRVSALADYLRARLDDTPGVRALDTGIRKCGIVTFDVAGHPAAEVSAALANQSINTGSPELSASRYDVASRSVPAVVRAGVHYFNTEDELDRLVAEVAALSG